MFLNVLIMKINIVNPMSPIINFIGSPFSFSGITSLTIKYKMTPEMKEKKIKRSSKL